MNLSQLTTFQTVMNSANLSEAAHRLGRTQPAISAAIKNLEDQLGLELFERKGRRMVPVPEAQYLLAEAEEIIARVSRVRQTMRGLVGGLSGTLSIAAMPGPVSLLFPRFVATYLAKDADVEISVSARSSRQITELARAQSIDFGFADFPEDVDEQSLYSANSISGLCFVAVPVAHELADKSSLSVHDLSGQAMGSLQTNHAHQTEVQAIFNAQGLAFRSTIQSQTFLPILQFVQAGRCCAIVDPLTVAHIRRSPEASYGIAILPLAETIRYRYAIISPLHRPVSIIAEKLRQAWFDELIRLLIEVGADPKADGYDASTMVAP